MQQLKARAATANLRSASKTHYYAKPSDHLANGWVCVTSIGEGRMSRVWEASRGQDRCAVKIFRKGGAEREAWANEMRIFNILDRTSHMQEDNPYLIRRVDTFVLIEICDDNQPRLHPCIALELMSYSLEEIKSLMSPSKARQYAKDLFLGLSVLHAEDIIHTDISIYNLLIRNDTLVISDFGSSCIVGEEIDLFYIGTPPYKSPEMLMRRPVTTATDIWSAFVVVFEMICGIPMFDLWGDAGVVYGFPEEFVDVTNVSDISNVNDMNTVALDDDIAMNVEEKVDQLTTDMTAISLNTQSTNSTHSTHSTHSTNSTNSTNSNNSSMSTCSSSDADEDYSEKHLRMITRIIGNPPMAVVGGCDHFTPGTNLLKIPTTPGTILEFVTSNFDNHDADAEILVKMLEYGLIFDPASRPRASEVVAKF